MVETISNNNNNNNNKSKYNDNKFKLIMSKMTKMINIFGSDFLTYLLDDETHIYSETMSCPEAFYYNETVNSEIKSFMNNHTWELIDLSLRSKPLGHKGIFKRKMKVDSTNDKYKLNLFLKWFRQ